MNTERDARVVACLREMAERGERPSQLAIQACELLGLETPKRMPVIGYLREDLSLDVRDVLETGTWHRFGDAGTLSDEQFDAIIAEAICRSRGAS